MRTLLIATLLGLAAPLCQAQNLPPIQLEVAGPVDLGSAPTKIPVKPVAFDVSAIDKSANPCQDFFQYACGSWNKNNPIPADRAAWGRFAELGEYNNYLLYKDLVAAAQAPKSPLQKKYGDYFVSCMNTEVLDKLGDQPLMPDLKAIDELTSVKQLPAFNAKQDRRGGGAFFAVAVTQDQKDSTQQVAATGQGGLTLPDRDYYLNESPRFVKIREGYVDNMVKTFQLLGDSPEKAAKEAADVMTIETALAKGSLDRVALRDPATRYHPMSVADLQAKTPNFDWKTYLDGIGLPEAKTVIVTSLPYLGTADAEITDQNLPAIKSYLRWHAVHSAAPLLSKNFEDLNFDFFQSHARRSEGAAAPLAALHLDHRSRARRGRRSGLGQAELPARLQGRHPASREGPRGCHGAGSPDPALDEPRDPRRGEKEARCHRRQDRLPQPLA